MRDLAFQTCLALLEDLPEDASLQVVLLPFCEEREGELISAIRQCSLSAVQAALDIPINPNTRNAARATPLEIAAGVGVLSIVRCLIEAGADKDGGMLVTPLAAAASRGYTHIVRYLLEIGAARDASVAPECTPLQAASEVNDVLIARTLVVARADLHAPDAHGQRPAHFAARAPGVEALQFLLKERADPNMADKQGNTPLHAAARQGRPKSVRLLLRRGADGTIVNSNGVSPGQLAQLTAAPPKIWKLPRHIQELHKEVAQILATPTQAKAKACRKIPEPKQLKRPASCRADKVYQTHQGVMTFPDIACSGHVSAWCH